jgi:hypothetical protein
MFFLNTPNVPFIFDGTNISEFLESYHDVAVDCDLDEKKMARRLLKYCEYMITGPFIESMKV